MASMPDLFGISRPLEAIIPQQPAPPPVPPPSTPAAAAANVSAAPAAEADATKKRKLSDAEFISAQPPAGASATKKPRKAAQEPRGRPKAPSLPAAQRARMAMGGEDDDDDLSEEQQMEAHSLKERNIAIVNQFSAEQEARYEAYKRAKFPKSILKKRMERGTNRRVAPQAALIANGVAKLFVGDLIEGAKAVMEELGASGPILPAHILEAHRRLALDADLPYIKKDRLFRH